ncbi:MAG: murein biosynthesis integral membrane protein MurJ [Candidatus Poribacteria bacterium]|nr:murein biosynthesis integral membrane protein MurJ [Candidatus Poribacteria bacterium]
MTNEIHTVPAATSEEHQRVTRSAGVVSIAVMGSRLLGLIREKAIAYYFAAGVGGDAFYGAFLIPNLMRDLFGEGALSKAFVTTFTATELADGEEAAWHLASRIFNAIILVLTVLTLIGLLAAPLIVDLIFMGKGFQDVDLNAAEHFGFTSKRDLTVYLTRIMFPFLTLVSLAAVAMGLLNSKGKFGVPACASSFFNMGSLVVGVWGYYAAPRLDLHPTTGMAVGVLVGGGLQFLIQVPSMWRVGFRYRPLISFRDKRVRQVMRLIGPAILGVAAVQVNVFVNGYFASKGIGWLAWIRRAFRLMHLPIGVFGVAISTAALPNLAKLVTSGDMEGFRRSFSYALRLMFLLTLPASIGLMVLAEPICRLIFEGGKAGTLDTQQTAGALFFYAFGLCGYSAVKITTDGFYAFNNTRTPAKVSLFAVGLNILLNYLFIYKLDFDHRSLALSTSCTITLNFLTLLFLLRRKIGRLGMGGIWRLLMKMAVASAVMGWVCWGSNLRIETWLGIAGVVAQLVGVFVPIGLGVVVLIGMCKLLKVGELDQLLTAIARRR